MSESIPYPKEQLIYNQDLTGYYGEFGTGGNSQISFIQTGLKATQLKKISLISEIPGSEKWQVRDLFQREVDQKRVNESILPYLQSDRVKFFNPITLTILPTNDLGQINSDIPLLTPKSKQFDSQTWEVLEYEPAPMFLFVECLHELVPGHANAIDPGSELAVRARQVPVFVPEHCRELLRRQRLHER